MESDHKRPIRCSKPPGGLSVRQSSDRAVSGRGLPAAADSAIAPDRDAAYSTVAAIGLRSTAAAPTTATVDSSRPATDPAAATAIAGSAVAARRDRSSFFRHFPPRSRFSLPSRARSCKDGRVMEGGSEGPPPAKHRRLQMIEPLFGSSPLNWPGIPSPTFGWFQTLPSLGTRAASTMSGIATSPQLTQVPHPQSFELGMPPAPALQFPHICWFADHDGPSSADVYCDPAGPALRTHH